MESTKKKTKLPIKIHNAGHRIKVTTRENSDGTYSIVLYYQIMVNGKRETGKKALSEKLHLKSSSKARDSRVLSEAMQIRDHIEHETRDRNTRLFVVEDGDHEKELLPYMKKIAQSYEGNTYKTWKNAIRKAEIFFTDTFLIDDLTKSICREFMEFLRSEVSPNSANLYFQKFKHTVKRMIEDDLIDKDLCYNLTIPTMPAKPEFLTLDEIKLVSKHPTKDVDVRNAFIFSCYTGLRISDLLRLTYDHIEDDKLHIIMQKTKKHLSLKLHKEALEIIEEQKRLNRDADDNRIFQLVSYEMTRRKWVRFIETTSIDKNIALHCARHTFTSLCVANYIDVYRVSKLLGHQDIKVTQRYLHLLDEELDKAIEKLPSLD